MKVKKVETFNIELSKKDAEVLKMVLNEVKSEIKGNNLPDWVREYASKLHSAMDDVVPD